MAASSSARFLRPDVRELAAYVPGTQPEGPGWVKLNTNENPYPPSPRVLAALAGEAERLRLYPHPQARALRERAALVYGVTPAQVFVGNGSDDVLNLLVRACVPAGGVVAAADPGYGLYAVLARANGARFVAVDYPEDFTLPEATCWPAAPLYFLTHPNSPSGVAVSVDAVERLARGLDGLLVVDEAYADFARADCLGLLHRCDNVFICRTFSKSFALAGLRLGLGLGSAAVVDGLDRLKDSYNVNRMALAAGTAALEDLGAMREATGRIVATRERVAAELARRGLSCLPSEANFLLARVGPDAARLQRELAARKVLVRHFSHPRLADRLRVSIGTDAEMDRFLAALDDARSMA